MLRSSGDGQRLFCQKCQTIVAFLQKLNCTNTFENREEWNCNVLIWCRKRCCIPQGMVNDSFVKTSGPRKRKLPKLYITSTLNIDLILWHIQSIVCVENVKSWFKSCVFPFTFQAYILPHTLNCICVSLFRFQIWILEQFLCRPKRPALPRHIKYYFHLNCLEHSICIPLNKISSLKSCPTTKKMINVYTNSLVNATFGSWEKSC